MRSPMPAISRTSTRSSNIRATGFTAWTSPILPRLPPLLASRRMWCSTLRCTATAAPAKSTKAPLPEPDARPGRTARLLCLVLCSLCLAPPLLWPPPAAWAAALGLVAIAGAVGQPWGRSLGGAALGALAYAGGAALPWAPEGLAAAALACLATAAALPSRLRGRVTVGVAAVAPAFGLVYGSLESGAVRGQFGALVVGLSLGVCCVLAWVAASGPSSSLLGRRVVAAIGLMVGFCAAARIETGSVAGIPAWQSASRRLLNSRRCDAPAARQELVSLRMAGFRDAGYVWAAAAVEENGTPQLLRRFCPRRGRDGVASEICTQEVAKGGAACRAALHKWPEQGARQFLVAGLSPSPSLQRLRGDLLMEAGAVAEALDAYAEAAQMGDTFARRDAVRELIERGREAEARELGHGVADPQVRTWLDGRYAGAVAAWNQGMAFATLEPPRRVGVRTRATPGAFLPVFSRSLGRHVATTLTRYASGFAVEVPPPPGSRHPLALRLEVQRRRYLRVDIKSDGRWQAFLCGDDPFRSRVSRQMPVSTLPAPACGGDWGVARVALPNTPVEALTLWGDFSLASLQVVPAEEER